MSLNINTNLSSDICPICHETLESDSCPVYTLPECGHTYHTNCIVTWFRTCHKNCPLCGFIPPQPVRNPSKDLLAEIRNYGRRKSSPIWLKKLLEKRSNISTKLKEYLKSYSNFKKDETGRTFKQHVSQDRIHRRNIYKCKSKLRQMDRALVSIPIVPIILPKANHHA